MASSRSRAVAGLAVWLAAALAASLPGCAQRRDATGPRAEAAGSQPAPVPTLGPDDGLPFPAPGQRATAGTDAPAPSPPGTRAATSAGKRVQPTDY